MANGHTVDRDARKARLELARGAAAVVGCGVAVVALLAADDDPVAALLGHAAYADHRTHPSGLDLARRIAAIAGSRVVVIALLAAAKDAIAANDRRNARLAR